MDRLTIMALGSTMLTALSKIGTGYANSQVDRLQQGIATNNAALLRNKANAEASEGQLSLDEASLNQSRTIVQVNRTLGAETGKFAASNLDPTSGSPLLLEGFSASQAATDMALIGAKGELGNAQSLLNAAGTMSQRAGQVGQAAAFGAKATSDIMTGYLGAGTSFLSGLGANNGAQWGALKSATSGIASGLGNFAGNFFVPSFSASQS